MKQLNRDDYRSLAKDVKLPAHVRASVLDEAARLHAAGAAPTASAPAPASASATAFARTRRSTLARRIATGACALALVAGVAAASGSLTGKNPFFGAKEATGNSFSLAAYASESSDEAGSSVALKREFGSMAGFQWSDNNDMESAFLEEDQPSASADDGTGFAGVSIFLDLSCIGENVDTLTYSIEGDGAYFYQENWNWGAPPFTVGPPSERRVQKSFSIAYDEQASDKAVVQRQLYLFFPLDEQAREVYERDGAGPPWREGASQGRQDAESHNSWNKELSAETMRLFAERIVEHPITLTAVFMDGSTQTNTYLIAPTSDFDEQLEAFRTSDEAGFSDLSPYFTLTETAEG